MTLNKLTPWGRKDLPIRRSDEYSSTPAVWSDFERPWRYIDQLFDRFLNFSASPFGLNMMDSQFTPSLDVHETDKEFQITIEVPGMDEKDIDISMSKDMLTISGEKKEEKKENAKGVYRMERRYGSFSRSIPLPESCVETEKAAATYNGGVLTIKLPKTPGYKESVKKIPVVSNTQARKDGNGGSAQT